MWGRLPQQQLNKDGNNSSSRASQQLTLHLGRPQPIIHEDAISVCWLHNWHNGRQKASLLNSWASWEQVQKAGPPAGPAPWQVQAI
jgi:hypothetical protein